MVLEEHRLIHDMGIKVSIDDFGTGYSSLDYLRRLPLDTLKIDQCFTREIGKSNNDEELIRLMLTMAKSLNLAVIAEGVETKEQYDFLKKYDCDMIQGYFFSKPCQAEKVVEIFSNKMILALARKPMNDDNVRFIR